MTARMRWPWEKDPNDREANYRRPVARAEVIRLSVKAAIAVAAGIGFRFASLDAADEGAELAIALGAAVAGAGITDLVYMRRHEIEQIFLTSPSRQRLARVGLVLAGVALLVAGTLAYAG